MQLSALRKSSVNLIFWTEMYIGTSMMFTLYLVEVFARQRISDEKMNELWGSLSFLVPRTFYLGTSWWLLHRTCCIKINIFAQRYISSMSILPKKPSSWYFFFALSMRGKLKNLGLAGMSFKDFREFVLSSWRLSWWLLNILLILLKFLNSSVRKL